MGFHLGWDEISLRERCKRKACCVVQALFRCDIPSGRGVFLCDVLAVWGAGLSVPNLGSIERIVFTRTGKPGTRLRARSGRNARTVRMAEKFASPPNIIGTHASVTTVKSSWHQGSPMYFGKP